MFTGNRIKLIYQCMEYQKAAYTVY